MLDVNNFDALKIGLASSEQIRAWSRGEVKKPDWMSTEAWAAAVELLGGEPDGMTVCGDPFDEPIGGAQ